MLFRRCRHLLLQSQQRLYAFAQESGAFVAPPSPKAQYGNCHRPTLSLSALLHHPNDDTTTTEQPQHMYTYTHPGVAWHRCNPHACNQTHTHHRVHLRSIHTSAVALELGVVSKLSMTQLAHRHETQLLSHAHSIEVVEFCLDGSVAEKVCARWVGGCTGSLGLCWVLLVFAWLSYFCTPMEAHANIDTHVLQPATPCTVSSHRPLCWSRSHCIPRTCFSTSMRIIHHTGLCIVW